MCFGLNSAVIVSADHSELLLLGLSLSVIGQRLIDTANHPISPVSMETRSGADVVGPSRQA